MHYESDIGGNAYLYQFDTKTHAQIDDMSAILRVIAEHEEGILVFEISKLIGLKRQTVSIILNKFVANNIIRYTDQGNLMRLYFLVTD